MGSDRFGRRHRPVGGHFNPRSPDGERQNRKRRSNQMKDFNPRSPDGERHTRRLCRTLTRNFNPRSPDGERHGLPCGEVASRFISIHTPRMGSDLWTSTWRCPSNHFNPRSPDGERPSPQYRSFRPAAISIHAPRMGSDCKLPGSGGACTISIHAPRMGSDYCGITCTSRRAYFNPRSPDGERLMDDSMAGLYSPFQSTLPGWGATRRPFRSVWRRNFNPRSPDGERHDTQTAAVRAVFISIHAPRMGSDPPVNCGGVPVVTFQSTLPGWGATPLECVYNSSNKNFNPRSPDGERPRPRGSAASRRDFNPRSPDGERPRRMPSRTIR